MINRIIKFGIGSLFFLSLFSCKEQPIGVDFSNIQKSDTTYVTTVDTPQTKNYYIEEFSGVRCTNCPQGAAKLEALNTANDGRLKIVTVHNGGLTAPNYNLGSKQDFRVVQGLQLMTLIYGGDLSKPNASFDRLNLGPNPTAPLVGAVSQWDAMLAAAKNESPSTPVNIYLESKRSNSDPNVFNIVVKLAYTESVATPQYLSIYLIEDNIIDNQIDPFIENFNFRHVFRQSLLPITGTPILADLSTIEPGRVYESKIKFVLDPNDEDLYRQKFWNLDNVYIVAFVHNGTAGEDKRVYQAVDTHLKP
ncbi:MAG TPA: Omp28-related outer membrane protein [Edaphocola sp.]|nr:Omp28-related outer membrane protein [Edaphocola sp.]